MAFPLAGLLVASAALAALGQVLIKVGATGRTAVADFVNLWVLLGLVSYAGGVLIWVYALSRAPLHAVYPFALLTFLMVGAASILMFDERPSALSVLGWGVIVAGLALVYLGTAEG
jgi:drug/metabolite transporter (DMT)-like permease